MRTAGRLARTPVIVCHHDESPFRKNEKDYASQTRDVHSRNP